MSIELKWSSEEKKFMALHLKLGIITYGGTPEDAMIQMDSIVLFDKISKKDKFVPLKPDLWGPLTESELKRVKSWDDAFKDILLEIEDEDTGLKL